MGLETVTYLDDLVTTNPLSGDPRSEGDDHLRNIKTALKNTLPGLAGRVWRKQSKSSGYTVIATDNMTWIDCTAGLTLSLTAVATIGNGFEAIINANGGDVTIDPNASEQVNGVTTFVIPNGRTGLLVCDGSAWKVFIMGQTYNEATVVSRSSNTILALADVGKTFRATASFTQTLTAAATLGNGWYCNYKIDAGVTITFDPNASETIDGATTRAVTGPAGLMIVCDGTNFHALGGAQVDILPSDTESDLASATTPNLGATTTRTVRITGTTDITGFGTAAQGTWRIVYFQSTGLKMTYNATSLILPIPFDIQVMAGDSMLAESLGSGNWKIHWYRRKNGEQVLGGRIPFGVIAWGCTNLPQSATNYPHQAQGAAVAGAEGYTSWVIPEACTISELRLKSSAALAGGSVVATVRKNSVDTALTCTLAAASGTTAADTTHSFDAEEGDEITLKLVAGAIGSTTDFGFTCVVEKKGHSVTGVPMHLSFNTGVSNGQNMYGRVYTVAAASEPEMEWLLPPCRVGTRAPMQAFSGSTGGYTGGTVRKNAAYPWNAKSPLSQTNDGSLGSLVTPGVRGPLIAFAEGERFSLRGINTTSDFIGVRQVLESLGPTEFEYGPSCIQFQSASQAQNLTRYACGGPAGDGAGNMLAQQSATESDVQIPMPACTLRGLRAVSNSTVASGTTVVTVRKNGVDTGLTCSLGTGGRTASDLTNSVVFAAGDLLTVSIVSGAAVGTRSYQISVEVNQ